MDFCKCLRLKGPVKISIIGSSTNRKDGLAFGKAKGMDGLLKTKLKLEHSVGLGHKPNVIPASEVEITGESRMVEIGWHPVGGLAGKWFAERTGLGKMITEGINHYPDPTQHWAVLVYVLLPVKGLKSPEFLK